MKQALVRPILGVLATGLLLAAAPAPRTAAASGKKATAVFAGGCYWGVESVFRHVKGVKGAVSGFAVLVNARPTSADGRADYVEAVRVEYDTTKVTYQQLLEIFFLVAHDPTQADRQGPDIGPEYRSVLFVTDSTQRQVARDYLDQLTNSHAYPRPILTEIAELKRFREAGPAQQDFAAKNPDLPYILINDVPKLEQLKQKYPALYRN